MAGTLAETLQQNGDSVDVYPASQPPPAPDAYDAVVVAASIHAGGCQRSVRRWVRTYADALAARPSAFVSVCLGVLQHEPAVQRDLQRILDDFAASTGWRPAVDKLVAGALPYTKYGTLRCRRFAGDFGRGLPAIRSRAAAR